MKKKTETYCGVTLEEYQQYSDFEKVEFLQDVVSDLKMLIKGMGQELLGYYSEIEYGGPYIWEKFKSYGVEIEHDY